MIAAGGYELQSVDLRVTDGFSKSSITEIARYSLNMRSTIGSMIQSSSFSFRDKGIIDFTVVRPLAETGRSASKEADSALTVALATQHHVLLATLERRGHTIAANVLSFASVPDTYQIVCIIAKKRGIGSLLLYWSF